MPEPDGDLDGRSQSVSERFARVPKLLLRSRDRSRAIHDALEERRESLRRVGCSCDEQRLDVRKALGDARYESFVPGLHRATIGLAHDGASFRLLRKGLPGVAELPLHPLRHL